MKKSLIMVLVLCLLMSTVGCSMFSPKTQEVEVTLYFPTSEGTMGTEKKSIKVSDDADALLTMTITELLKGPEEDHLETAIPQGTRLLDAKVQDGVATLNLSQEFLNFGGVMQEAMALISLVNTSTDLPGIDEVLIKVEGEDLISPSGEPYGTFKKYDIDEINRDLLTETITLYFPNEDAMFLVPEEREVVVDRPKEEIVMEELLKGPESPNLTAVNIPEGTKLLSIKVEDGTAFVDFSKELKENHSGGSTGEAMTIYPIVNTLTQLPDIQRVQFLIEGEEHQELAGHMTFNQPFERNENIIEK